MLLLHTDQLRISDRFSRGKPPNNLSSLPTHAPQWLCYPSLPAKYTDATCMPLRSCSNLLDTYPWPFSVDDVSCSRTAVDSRSYTDTRLDIIQKNICLEPGLDLALDADVAAGELISTCLRGGSIPIPSYNAIYTLPQNTPHFSSDSTTDSSAEPLHAGAPGDDRTTAETAGVDLMYLQHTLRTQVTQQQIQIQMISISTTPGIQQLINFTRNVYFSSCTCIATIIESCSKQGSAAAHHPIHILIIPYMARLEICVLLDILSIAHDDVTTCFDYYPALICFIFQTYPTSLPGQCLTATSELLVVVLLLSNPTTKFCDILLFPVPGCIGKVFSGSPAGNFFSKIFNRKSPLTKNICRGGFDLSSPLRAEKLVCRTISPMTGKDL